MSKKISLPINLFLEPDIEDPKTKVRFRIISEDRNSISAWSPIFSIDPEFIFVAGTNEIPGTIQLNKNTGYVSAVWSDVSIYKEVSGVQNLIGVLPSYDVWIRLAGNGGSNPSEWIYKGRIASTSLNIGYATTYPYTGGTGTTRQMTVEVYRPAKPVTQNSTGDFLVYTSTITNL